MPRGTPSWTSNFNRFWIDFGSQLVTPEPTKSPKFYWFYKHFLLCGIFKIRSNFDPFWCQLASIFLAKIHQNPFKNRFPKPSMFRSIFASIFIPFWLQLGAFLGLKLEPSWPLKSAKSRPRRHPRRAWERKPAQTFNMAPKFCPSSPPRAPTTPPRPSQTLPKPPKTFPKSLLRS